MAASIHPIERESMRKSGIESRSRYLSLALASRKLMRSLDQFGSTGRSDDDLRNSIANLLQILDTGWQANNSFAPVPTESPFSRYEQAATVNEVVASFDPGVVRAKLSGILEGHIGENDRQAVVREVNRFLYSLENSALHTYNDQFDEP